MDLEALSTKEVAYHITLFDWDLFWAVHEYELLYHTFGRHHFGKVSYKNTKKKSFFSITNERFLLNAMLFGFVLFEGAVFIFFAHNKLIFHFG